MDSWHRDARCQVVDAIHFLEQCPQLGTIVDITAGEMDLGSEPVRVAGREVIQIRVRCAPGGPANWSARNPENLRHR